MLIARGIDTKNLCSELSAQIGLERSLGTNKLHVSSILYHLLLRFQLQVVLLVHLCESPLLRDDDLLTSRELVTGTAEGLLDDGCVGISTADREDDLADVDTGDGTVGLAPCTTHTSLEPISPSTRQHLVDPDDMEGMYTDPQMERVLARSLGDILIGADTRSLECLARKLLVLVRYKMAAEGEVINGGTFATQVEDTDLWVRDATVVARLGVGFVLTVTIAASRTTTHLEFRLRGSEGKLCRR
jgi:hypothetical protein